MNIVRRIDHFPGPRGGFQHVVRDDRQLRIACDGNPQQLRRRIGMRKTAADRPAIADLVMRHMRDGRHQQGMRMCESIVPFNVAPSHKCADVQAVSADVDLLQPRQAADIDQEFWRREPEGQHRHQALTTRDHLGFATVRGKDLDRLRERARANIFQLRKLHCVAPNSQLMRMTSHYIRILKRGNICLCANVIQLLPVQAASRTGNLKRHRHQLHAAAPRGGAIATEKAAGSSRKVLRALMAFSADAPRHSAESLAQQIGLPLSSTYRYLKILREAALVEEDSRGSFVLAPRVIGLAQAARAGTNLAAIARPHMKRLSQETGETVILVRRSGDRAICIERVESSSRIRLTFEVGTALPLHRGAAPKLLLAYLSPTECKDTLEKVIASNPDFASQLDPLLHELAIVRRQGWSESRAEITPHVYAVAVGIVESGGVVAAVSILPPSFRIPRSAQIKLRNSVQRAATDIAKSYAAVTIQLPNADSHRLWPSTSD